jgi:hypothetical protein
LLSSIYDNIYANEIRMKDEAEAAAINSVMQPGTGIAGALANVGLYLQKEAYVVQSTGMTNKTEVRIHVVCLPQGGFLGCLLALGTVQNHDARSAARCTTIKRAIL